MFKHGFHHTHAQKAFLAYFNEYVLRGMMWADNCWLFCDNKERWACMVNDIIQELLDLDMEPKPESLRWTITYKDGDRATLRVGKEGLMWDLPHKEVLGSRYHRDGKGFQGAERMFCKGMASWWKDRFFYRSRSVPIKTRCQRTLSHVYSAALNGSVNWSWSIDMLTKVQQNSTSHLSPQDARGREVGKILTESGQYPAHHMAQNSASHGAK